MSRTTNRESCVYCGQQATTRDHLPPKCLLGKTKPANLIVVPSCEKCNNKAGRDDEYVMRLAAVEGAERTQAGRDVDEAFQKALTRKESKGLRAAFEGSLYPVEVVTGSGLFVRQGVAFNLEWDRMTTLLDRLTRGYFWLLQKRRLPDGYRTDWHPVSSVPHITPEKAENQRIISTLPFWDYGGGTFQVRAVIPTPESNLTIFRFDFYLTHGFIGYTVRQEPTGQFSHLVINLTEPQTVP